MLSVMNLEAKIFDALRKNEICTIDSISNKIKSSMLISDEEINIVFQFAFKFKKIYKDEMVI